MYAKKKPGIFLVIAAILLYLISVASFLAYQYFVVLRYNLRANPGIPTMLALAVGFLALVFTLISRKSKGAAIPAAILGVAVMVVAIFGLLEMNKFAPFRLMRTDQFLYSRIQTRINGSRAVFYLPSPFAQYVMHLLSGLFVLIHAIRLRMVPEEEAEAYIPASTSAYEGHTAASERSAYAAANAYESAELFTGSIGKMIVLTIITFCIYGLVWQYRLTRNMRIVAREDRRCTGEFLLQLFVPFYMLYWYHKRARTFAEGVRQDGWYAEDRSTLYVILGLIGLGIVNICLMQDDCNKLAAGTLARLDQSAAASASVYAATSAAGPAPATAATKSAPAGGDPEDVMQLIKDLARLHEQGILTDEEFEQKKAQLLAKL